MVDKPPLLSNQRLDTDGPSWQRHPVTAEHTSMFDAVTDKNVALHPVTDTTFNLQALYRQRESRTYRGRELLFEILKTRRHTSRG